MNTEHALLRIKNFCNIVKNSSMECGHSENLKGWQEGRQLIASTIIDMIVDEACQ